jgi:hypothetical protein
LKLLLRCALTAAVALPGSLLVVARPHGSKNPVFDQINSIVQTLSDITGLSEKHSVPYGWMDKKQLRRFLVKRIKRTLHPEEIHNDELALKMFGLVPQDFDLRKSTIDLLTEQAAAFYDYDNKKLYLLQGTSLAAETTALAHELSHALADQYFDLGKFMDETPASDDENLAHTAVVEGQASWLMIAYDLKVSGKDPVPTPDMLKGVADSSDDSMSEFPVLKASPLYIQQSLLFPYSEGTLFFAAVYNKEGKKSFGAVFEEPPVDTAQIIHPERYFTHQLPTSPVLPGFSSQQASVEITKGALGEFDHEMMLRQYAGQELADSLSPHLHGSRFAIVEGGAERQPVLKYASEWDSAESAGRFFRAYRKILQGKWKRCDLNIEKDSLLAGSGDNGYFVTRLNGVDVTSIEGLSDAAEWRHLQDMALAGSSRRVVFQMRATRF